MVWADFLRVSFLFFTTLMGKSISHLAGIVRSMYLFRDYPS
jgi:hypothetical protein